MKNPLEKDVDALEGSFRSQLKAIETSAGEPPPVDKRLLTRKEKLMVSLAAPPDTWTPQQAGWVLQELDKERRGRGH